MTARLVLAARAIVDLSGATDRPSERPVWRELVQAVNEAETVKQLAAPRDERPALLCRHDLRHLAKLGAWTWCADCGAERVVIVPDWADE